MTPLYLVDDDQDVLDSLSWMLEGMGLNCKGFNAADAFLKSVDIKQPAVLLLDIKMPGMDGVALLSHLNQAQSVISVIMLTGHGTIAMAVDCIQQGALNFLEKPVDGEKLFQLLTQAQQHTEQKWQQQNLQSDIAKRLATLSQRETQVMEGILAGKMNKVIAAELDIAQRTIELHRQKVMQKMQVSNAAELAWLLANHKF
ncbi:MULTISPECIES: response regulator transcription factor [Shewanella]|uniref:Response regulator n=1 Tax=Shewanella xiamenensis TaxID=332186 RepID=A0ABT6U6R3_9GAMM|nr:MULTISPECIES: response regulator [Shewanella]PZP36109.1 MAG: DNA-binding response regulator [Shewanella oneidensis]MBW0297241.1 DNA-binding response regulator [Shewanella xiamenensis]MCT8861985.1 response regulator [Shewanella xiamenensis]MCT8874486.1 response regulator [Shewanella xiamenensis]MDI5830137.1 response regulator [Shewanella xiamenensis]